MFFLGSLIVYTLSRLIQLPDLSGIADTASEKNRCITVDFIDFLNHIERGLLRRG